MPSSAVATNDVADRAADDEGILAIQIAANAVQMQMPVIFVVVDLALSSIDRSERSASPSFPLRGNHAGVVAKNLEAGLIVELVD